MVTIMHLSATPNKCTHKIVLVKNITLRHVCAQFQGYIKSVFPVFLNLWLSPQCILIIINHSWEVILIVLFEFAVVVIMFILHINLNLTISHFLFVEHFKMFVCSYRYDMQYGCLGDSNEIKIVALLGIFYSNPFFINIYC